MLSFMAHNQDIYNGKCTCIVLRSVINLYSCVFFLVTGEFKVTRGSK